MKKILLFIYILFTSAVSAQVNESFSDGDFTNGISWSGSNASWQVVATSDVSTGATGSNTLRLNTASGSGNPYLSTQVMGNWGTQQTWGFWFGRRSQAATASNMIFVWLFANEANVTSNTVDGYRIRFGDDLSGGDKIIFEKVMNGVGISLLSSGSVTNGITDYGILVRLTRDGSGQWNLFTSTLPTASGTGAVASAVPNANNTNVLQGTIINNDFTVFDNGYIAVGAVHSSIAAARTGAEFDQLIFSFDGSAPLPVRFGNILAYANPDGIHISWDNFTESEIEHYMVERSLEGRDFAMVATLHPERNDGGKASYQYSDKISKPKLFYRIRAKENGGAIIYSRIIRVDNKNDKKYLMVYPHPVQGKNFQVVIDQLTRGLYTMTLYNSASQMVYNKVLEHMGGGFSASLVHEQLVRGAYLLQLKGPEIMQKIVVVQ